MTLVTSLSRVPSAVPDRFPIIAQCWRSHMALPLNIIDVPTGKYSTKCQYMVDLIHVYLTSIITRTHYREKNACQKHGLSFT